MMLKDQNRISNDKKKVGESLQIYLVYFTS